MFRYIALVWDESIPLHSSAAKRLSDELLSLAPWSAAHCSAGLRVFTAGLKQGVNSAYPILGDRGVVLGKLFRRQDLMHGVAKDGSLTEVDAHRQRCGRAPSDANDSHRSPEKRCRYC